MTTRIPLSALSVGERFALPNDDGTPRRTGTLLALSVGSARVKWDGEGRHVELGDGTAFDVPGRAVNIALGTEVMRLDGDA